MAKPETSLWDYLRTVLPSKGHYSRIESDTCPGFPDVHYSLHGFTGSIELKIGNPKAKMPFLKSGLRKTQMDWMEEEDKADGTVWIIAQVGDNCLLISGNNYWEDFNRMELADLKRVSAVDWVRGYEEPTSQLAEYLEDRR